MKHILVTGATGGLGRAVVGLCLDQSHQVTGLYRKNAARAEALRSEHAGARSRLDLRQVDLRDLATTTRVARELAESRTWDALIHLSAAPVELLPLSKQVWDCFEIQWQTMVRGAVLLTQAILPGMKRQRRGHLIYCLSAVTLGPAPKGMVAYTTAKYGLWGFVRTVAGECAGTGISVNAVSPGPMETGLLENLPEIAKAQLRSSSPSGEFLDPAIVAKAILRLLDTPSSSLYDANIPVLASKISPSR